MASLIILSLHHTLKHVVLAFSSTYFTGVKQLGGSFSVEDVGSKPGYFIQCLEFKLSETLNSFKGCFLLIKCNTVISGFCQLLNTRKIS